MCSICGIYNEQNKEVIGKMLQSIQHRGPDSFQTMLIGDHSVGACRLNIIGDTNISYPLVDKESGICLLFNGEIYNYKELKKELIDEKYVFQTNTDAEVLLPLYKKYKENCAQYVNGMFSFAIIDKDKLILGRDRYGIKPLYYYQSNSKIIFGSEIKAILQYPNILKEIDTQVLDEISVFGYIYSPDKTLLKNIRQVPPATTITFENQTVKTKQYYSSPKAFISNNGSHNYEKCISELSVVLEETIKKFWNHGKQEKGIFLSGGVDSSLMAVLASKISGEPINTFTLADSETNEDFVAARNVAKSINSHHHEFIIGIDEYLEELPRFISHYENLVTGGVFDIQGSMAFQMLSKKASQYVKVAFTGEGADELFGGYRWFYTHPLGFSDRIKNRAKKIQSSVIDNIVEGIFPQEDEREELYRKNVFDLLIGSGLSNCHLWSVDRSSSCFGFEIRPPYMDDDLVSHALSLPLDFKVPDKITTKKILKDVGANYFLKLGLENINKRKKQGMPAAIGNIEVKFNKMISELIPDNHFYSHPYKKYLGNKSDVAMFDLFYYIFIYGNGLIEKDFQLTDFFKSGGYENLYNREISPS